MADEDEVAVRLIKKVNIPVRLFGDVEVGHADVVEFDNHIKVNVRIRKDQASAAQLLGDGLAGFTIEYESAIALDEAIKAEAERRRQEESDDGSFTHCD